MKRAAFLLPMLLAGCVVHRITNVHIDARDRFDIAPVVGQIDLNAQLTFPPCALSDHAPPAALPPNDAAPGVPPAPAGLFFPTPGARPW